VGGGDSALSSADTRSPMPPSFMCPKASVVVSSKTISPPSNMAPSETRTRLNQIRIDSKPFGPGELEVSYFGFEDGVNRSGRPCKLLVQVVIVILLALPLGLSVTLLGAVLTAAMMVETLATTRGKLSKLIEELPQYCNIKARIPCPDNMKRHVLSTITQTASNMTVETIDG
jgi:hypothetical protein